MGWNWLHHEYENGGAVGIWVADALAVLKQNRLIRKRMDVNCSRFHL
jgi:hypothetical protein